MAAEVTRVKRPGLRERNKELTRLAILRAAMLLITRDGVAATSMDGIAELAEVSDTTVFNYFKTKDQLVTALIEEATGARGMATLLASRPADEPPLVALRQLMESQPLPTAEELAQRRRIYDRAREDPLLWGAYLRWTYDVADEIAESFAQRAPHWTPTEAKVAAHATFAALEAVFATLPPKATVKGWLKEIEKVLSQLEGVWQS